MSHLRRQPTLTTARLVLRPFTLADAPQVRELAGAFAVADTTLHIPHPYPEGAAEAWIAMHGPEWATGAGATFAVTEREGAALVGAIGVVIDAASESAELGYWIAADRWGRGYATEAGRVIVAYCFAALGLRRVHARHFTRNPASGRVLEKLGMQRTGQRSVVRKAERDEEVAELEIVAEIESAGLAE